MYCSVLVCRKNRTNEGILSKNVTLAGFVLMAFKI